MSNLEQQYADDRAGRQERLEAFREYLTNGLEMISGARDATTAIYIVLGILGGFLLVHLMRRGIRRTFQYDSAQKTPYRKIEDSLVMTVSVIATVVCTLAVIGFIYK